MKLLDKTCEFIYNFYITWVYWKDTKQKSHVQIKKKTTKKETGEMAQSL